MSRRLNPIAAAAATGIALLHALSFYGQWDRVAIILGIQIALIPFNVWVTLRLLARHGRRAEMLRTGVNLTASILSVELGGFALPAYLWIPFVALAFDHLGRRV